MRKKIVLIITFLSIFSFLYGQEERGKFYSGLGFGYKQSYNNLLFPYAFSGLDFTLNLEWQTINENRWMSDINILFHYSSLHTSTSAVKIKQFNPTQQSIGAAIGYQRLKEIKSLSNDNFSFFVGGNLNSQVDYQISYTMEEGGADVSGISSGGMFLLLDFSLGLSLYAEYKIGKVRISDNLTTLLFAGMFYPYYGGHADPFFSTGSAGDYFTTATIGKLNRITNSLKVEFPFIIKGKVLNTFYLGYNFSYEYSTVRDNKIEDIGHAILFGMVFKLSKLAYN